MKLIKNQSCAGTTIVTLNSSNKITIAQVLKDPAERDMDAIKAISTACMDSEDFREGRRAFMEKRKPQFQGR